MENPSLVGRLNLVVSCLTSWNEHLLLLALVFQCLNVWGNASLNAGSVTTLSIVSSSVFWCYNKMPHGVIYKEMTFILAAGADVRSASGGGLRAAT